ncbi:MAG TPA: hypothetical protein VFX21_08990 [Acidimicrobiia bacterium]|nr:hypothetical protein [Acidimicrobiia bacterium]
MSRDRRAGVALFAVVALALGITTAVTDSVFPPVRHDTDAYEALLALLDANESGTWIVDYDMQRTIAGGRHVATSYTEARDDEIHIVRGGGSADATIGDKRYLCTDTEEAGTICNASPAVQSLASSVVVKTAVESGAYVVTTLPSDDIAGEHARCYRLFGAGGYIPELGAETRYCFADDGVQLRTKITTVNDERDRVATRVVRDPSSTALEQVIGSLETGAGSADGDDTN